MVPPGSGTILASVRKAGKPMTGGGNRETSSAASHIAALAAGRCLDALQVQVRGPTVPGDCHPCRSPLEKTPITNGADVTGVEAAF